MFRPEGKSSRGCWIVGHRGALGHAPENTMVSFLTGHKLGADSVECDVHLSKDGRCVVIHDDTLDRTTTGSGPVRNWAWNKIRKLDAGSWFSKDYAGERVPLLGELLSWAKKNRSRELKLPLGIVVEIKSEKKNTATLVKKVVQEIQKSRMESRVIVISFDHLLVKMVKKTAPDILTGILYHRRLKNPVATAKKMSANAIFPLKDRVTKTVVKNAHNNGLFVGTWTVNDLKEMKKMVGCGVDAIATNFPDRLDKVLLRIYSLSLQGRGCPKGR